MTRRRSSHSGNGCGSPGPDWDVPVPDRAGCWPTRAYSSTKIRAHLRRRGITATIPEPANQIAHRTGRSSTGGRRPAFDTIAYKDRNTVERAFNKLEAFRAVAMRTDKREYVYRGTIDIASIKIWLRDLTRKDPPDTP